MLWKHREKTDQSENPVKVCPVCLSKYSADYTFCPRDGYRLVLEKDTGHQTFLCSNCGAIIQSEDEECLECGFHQGLTYPIIRIFPLFSSMITIWKFPYIFGRKDVSRIYGAEYVNDRHIKFSRSGDVIKVRDLKSLNGTRLNGHLLGGSPEALKSGDILELAVNGNGDGIVKLEIQIISHAQEITVRQP